MTQKLFQIKRSTQSYDSYAWRNSWKVSGWISTQSVSLSQVSEFQICLWSLSKINIELISSTCIHCSVCMPTNESSQSYTPFMTDWDQEEKTIKENGREKGIAVNIYFIHLFKKKKLIQVHLVILWTQFSSFSPFTLIFIFMLQMGTKTPQ